MVSLRKNGNILTIYEFIVIRMVGVLSYTAVVVVPDVTGVALGCFHYVLLYVVDDILRAFFGLRVGMFPKSAFEASSYRVNKKIQVGFQRLRQSAYRSSPQRK